MSYLIPQGDILDAYAQTGRRNLSGLSPTTQEVAAMPAEEAGPMLEGQISSIDAEFRRTHGATEGYIKSIQVMNRPYGDSLMNQLNAIVEYQRAAYNDWQASSVVEDLVAIRDRYEEALNKLLELHNQVAVEAGDPEAVIKKAEQIQKAREAEPGIFPNLSAGLGDVKWIVYGIVGIMALNILGPMLKKRGSSSS